MRMPRRAILAVAAIAIVIGAAILLACGGFSRAETAKASVPVKIGFSLDSLVVERWGRDRDVFVATANSLGASVVLRDAGGDARLQAEQVRGLIDLGVDVIVIVPGNADLFVDAVQRAKSRGIKVISYDRLIRNAGVDLYVSVNSLAVGALMARAIARAVPEGNYAFIDGPKSDFNVDLIQWGQNSVLQKYAGARKVDEFYAKDWSSELAYGEVSRLLASGERIDAIVCMNDGLAYGAIHALAEYRLAGKVPVVGQDADISACQFIVEGSQLMTVYKPIWDLARQAATFAVEMARGEFKKPDDSLSDGTVDVPVYWLDPVEVNRDNIKRVVIDSGFHTAEEIYRNVPEEKRPAEYR
jgi:D-xylose transport system substrate-binding protein